MLYNIQRTIVAATARIDLSDASVYLKGSEVQVVTIDGSGAGAAPPGASFRIINGGAYDATFVPGLPQKVAGGSQLTISAGSGVTLELSPDGDWIVV